MPEFAYLLVQIPETDVAEIGFLRKLVKKEGFEDAVISPRRSLYFTKDDWEAADSLFKVGKDRELATTGHIEISTPTEITPEQPIGLSLRSFWERGLLRVEVSGTTDFERAVEFAKPELGNMDWKHEVFEEDNVILFTEFPVEG